MWGLGRPDGQDIKPRPPAIDSNSLLVRSTEFTHRFNVGNFRGCRSGEGVFDQSPGHSRSGKVSPEFLFAFHSCLPSESELFVSLLPEEELWVSSQHLRLPRPFLRSDLRFCPRSGVNQSITSKITSPSRFSINLMCSNGDIAFHFNPRFDEESPVIICNTWTNKTWGAEDRTLQVPFRPGEPFEMTITVQHAYYEVRGDPGFEGGCRVALDCGGPRWLPFRFSCGASWPLGVLDILCLFLGHLCPNIYMCIYMRCTFLHLERKAKVRAGTRLRCNFVSDLCKVIKLVTTLQAVSLR